MTASSGPDPGAAVPRPTRSWRPDIQGLRAVAVLLVVVRHAGLGLPGGYTGVDVFFVISGFLISQLLFREAAAEGRVSLTAFYARRARRILPAATVVLLATLIASVAWISKAQVVDVGHDAWWAALFVANIRFARLEIDYFAQGQAPSPLQHYWSLSVEEQFYLVWPLLLLATLALVHRRSRGGLPRAVIASVLAVVTAASLIWSARSTHNSPQTAYFSTPARAWELAIGALVALVGGAVVGRWKRHRRELCGVSGLMLIAVSALAFDSRTQMPGTAALAPALGSALVLLAGTATTGAPTFTARCLSVTPMRRIGDWSYSIYLWHWPVLLIPALYVGHPLHRLATLALAMVSIGLSAATYRYVETPVRTGFQGGWPRLTPLRSVLLYPVSVGLVGLLAVTSTHYVRWTMERGNHPPVTLSNFGVPDEGAYRLPSDPRLALVEASVVAAQHHMALPSHLSPNPVDVRRDLADVGGCDYRTGTHRLCPRGAPHGDRTLVVLGDSHARMWIPALDRIARDAGYRAYFLVLPSCKPGRMALVKASTSGPFRVCSEFNAWAMARVAELRPDVVVVASAPVNKHGGVLIDGGRTTVVPEVAAATQVGYVALFDELSSYTGRTVLIADVPKPPDDISECLTTGHPDLGTCAFSPLKRPERLKRATVDAADAAGVQVIDPRPWLCWQNTCAIVVGHTITYRDGGHITATYAADLTPDLGEALSLGQP